MEKIKKKLCKGENFKDIENWLEEIYKVTKIMMIQIQYIPNILDFDTDVDVAVIQDLDEQAEKGLRQITRCYPQIKNLMREDPVNGECVYIMNKTSIITNNGQVYEEITIHTL